MFSVASDIFAFDQQVRDHTNGRKLVGDTGTCPPTSLDGGGTQYAISPQRFLVEFVFGEVSKLNVTFVTFCVKSFSC